MSKRICAWCGEPLGSGNGADNTETHGICSNCLATHFSQNIVSILSGRIEQQEDIALFQSSSIQAIKHG